MGRGSDEGSGQAGRDGVDAGRPMADAVRALESLHAAADLLAASALSPLSDREVCELVEVVGRTATRVHAGWLRLVKELDDRHDAVTAAGSASHGVVPGARKGQGAATFLVHRLNSSAGQARRDVAAAHALDEATGTLPRVGAALRAGTVSRESADICVRAAAELPTHLATRRFPDEEPQGAAVEDGMDDGTEEELGDGPGGRTGLQVADAFLAGQARTQPPRALRFVVEQLLARIAPDRADRFDPDAHTRRTVTFGVDSRGMTVGRFALAPAEGALFRAAIGAYAAPLPTAPALDEDGQEVLLPDLRTTGQRNADALRTLVGLATGSGEDRANGRGPVTVTVVATAAQVAAAWAAGERGRRAAAGDPAPAPGHAPGLAVTGDGRPLGPLTLDRLLCGSTLRRVLTGPSGAVLDLGTRVRLATSAQKEALVARDGGCSVPACPAPGHACDVHHVTPWAAGGPTDLANLALVCPRHHTEIHLGFWTLVMRDGAPWAVPPAWIDPQRRPLRRALARAADQARRVGEQLRLLVDPPQDDTG